MLIPLQQTWGGGLSTTRSAVMIGPNEAPSTDDAVIVEDVWLSPARLQQTQVTDSGAGTESVRSLIASRDTAGGTLYRIFVNGTKIRRTDLTTITNITGAVTLTLDSASKTRKASIVAYNGTVIGCNGNDTVWTASGSAGATALGGSPPTASKYAAVHQDHVVLLQATGEIRVSDYQNAASWPATLDYVPVKFSGARATGIVDRGDYCWVFFEDSIWTFDFISKFYRPIQATEGIGCPYPWTIRPYKGGVVYLGPDNVYLYAGGTPQPMTRGIETTIANKVTPKSGNEEIPWGAVLDTKYFLFYDSAQNAAVDGALIFDFRYGTWYGPEKWGDLTTSAGDCGSADILPDSDGVRRLYIGAGQKVARWPSSSATTVQTAFNAQTRIFADRLDRKIQVNALYYWLKGGASSAVAGDQSQMKQDDTLQVAVRMNEQSAWTSVTTKSQTTEVQAGQDGWRRFTVPLGDQVSDVNTLGYGLQVKFTQRAATEEFTLGRVEADVVFVSEKA